MPITPSAAPLFTGQIRPPDVPAYVPQQIAYPTGGGSTVVGDGTTTGGFAPFWASQGTDTPTPNRTNWLVDPALNLADFLTVADPPGTKTEAKFRTHARTGAPRYADNMRYYGDTTPLSHLHTPFGAFRASSFTTRETLRNPVSDEEFSGAAGGLLNSTNYLMPSLIVDLGGKTYAIAPGHMTIYYQMDPFIHDQIHPAPLPLRYVAGFDMDNINRHQELSDMANLDNGGGGRFRPHQQSLKAAGIFHTWFAINPTTGNKSSDYLQLAGGADAFDGSLTVASGGDELQIQFAQDLFWDGVNPWSPRGYDHVLPGIWDNTDGHIIGPDGWYHLPTPLFSGSWNLAELEAFLGGPLGSFNPRLSSDEHHMAMHGTLPGQTFHWDWTNGWDEETIRNWETNAIGCGVLSGTPHELNDSVVDADEKLIVLENSPTTGLPQVDFNRGIQTFELPPTGSAITTRLA